ncbi:MAG: efflux RND transporter periplasmic adaptor subunit [Microgenomates group bacterium]
MKEFFKKRWWAVFFIILVFFVGYFIVKGNNQKIKKKEYKVVRKDLKEELTLSGKIEAGERVVLRFQTSGKLAWVGVKEGDYVRKYQAIASLDQRDLKNRLQKYLNTYVNQRLSFEQTKDDNWQKQFDLSETIRKKAERILEQNQYNLDNAVLDVEYQNLALEYANLITPIEGIVTRIDVPYAGVNITPAQAEFEIVNPKTLYFSATADQTEVILLKEGQKGKIILDSFPDDEIQGEIYWISFSPKQGETGTVYEIKMKLSTDKPLRLEMSGDVNFVTKEIKNVITIPRTFLKNDKKGSYVNLFDNGKKVKRYVEKEDEVDGQVIIKNGLKEGEIIYD